jgi:hypothetical protein
MVNRKIILLVFAIILIAILVFIFTCLIYPKEERKQELNNAEIFLTENDIEGKLREVVNKTIRDLDLSLNQECGVGDGRFICEGVSDEEDFQISFIKTNYGEWVNSWNILLNKTNKQEGEIISKSKILNFETYSQSLTQNIEGGIKQVRETTSIFDSGYSFSATTRNVVSEKKERVSSLQIIEKIISNLKNYE